MNSPGKKVLMILSLNLLKKSTIFKKALFTTFKKDRLKSVISERLIDHSLQHVRLLEDRILDKNELKA